MKKLTKEYTEKSVADMNKEIAEVSKNMARMKIEAKVKPNKDTNAMQKMKKRIAVMKTVIRQKELGIQK